jgi:hypothetical protein
MQMNGEEEGDGSFHVVLEFPGYEHGFNPLSEAKSYSVAVSVFAIFSILISSFFFLKRG